MHFYYAFLKPQTKEQVQFKKKKVLGISPPNFITTLHRSHENESKFTPGHNKNNNNNQ